MKKGNMFTKLLLLFTIVPVVEVFLLFKISGLTNWLVTMLIVISTGVIGAYLAKSEGKGIIDKIKNELSYGSLPKDELIGGLCVLIGGVLLVTPGVLTDLFGFSLIIPLTRNIYVKLIKSKFKNIIDNGNSNFVYINKGDWKEK